LLGGDLAAHPTQAFGVYVRSPELVLRLLFLVQLHPSLHLPLNLPRSHLMTTSAYCHRKGPPNFLVTTQQAGLKQNPPLMQLKN
jgi:hypothetical protein